MVEKINFNTQDQMTKTSSNNLTGFNRLNLDIVQDSRELDGNFPQNVDLKFLFWNHAYLSKPLHEGRNDIYRIAEHLDNTDILAMEVAGSATDEDKERGVETVDRELDLLNKYNKSDKQKKFANFFEETGLKNCSNILSMALFLSLDLRNKGVEKLPLFVPIDIWKDGAIDTNKMIQKSHIQTFEERAQTDAAFFRYRERTALKQLNNYAVKLSKDGKKHQISILYGANHTLLSVAAQILGAPVERVFLDPPLLDAVSMAERSIRLNHGNLRKDEIDTYEKACKLGVYLGSEALRLGVINDEKTVPTIVALETLCLRSIQKSLTPSQDDRFKQEMDKFRAYEAKNPKLFNKKKVKNAISELFALAYEIIP